MAPNGDAQLFGGGAPTAAASHRSIGEVLALLKDEFPDITISKIRFLESQGLLDPERTPSGYRRFYDKDVERLRWILRQQRENFLPLKVIKGRLAEGADTEAPADVSDTEPAAPGAPIDEPAATVEPAAALDPAVTVEPTAVTTAARAGQPASVLDIREPRERHEALGARPTPVADAAPQVAVAPPAPVPADAPVVDGSPGDERPASGAAPSTPVAPEPVGGAASEPAEPGGSAARRRLPEPALFTHRGVTPEPSTYSRLPGDTSVSLTAEELAGASGLSVSDIAELERFDLIEHRSLGATAVYDDEALLVARAAAQLRAHGVEPRHLRMYKIAADREAGVYEQVVLPILRQRDPESRRRANDTIEELARLGEGLHAAMLRRALKDLRG